VHRSLPATVFDVSRGQTGMEMLPLKFLAAFTTGAVLMLLLSFTITDTAIVPMEERSLRLLHPAEYAEYSGRVRRWL
jgi:protein-S-isoprenylcysteine O-methyltransferase Ste14